MTENQAETLALIVPVYNEAEIISEVLKEWDATLGELGLNYRIHAYNDGSTDNSLEILNVLARDMKSLEIHASPNCGHGPTLLKGYTQALHSTWIFQTDSDGEMSAKHFNELWANRGEYDFLLGRRSQRSQALSRRVVSFISRSVIRLFYARGVWDVNSPFRLMRVSAVSKFLLNIPSDTFAPNLIISGMVNLKKCSIYETLIPHQERQTGEVSIKKFRLLMAALISFGQTILFRIKSG
ncbi:MAG: glycosyltransferase family 2 protein [Candidatus Marinimicrobia bacterium]|jgi:glycosyltransferase involved in cell wall biosynthesis|nr:glycosyltransferase family 2 protein [Candidatus Neomarinimicrobiota bacterium]MBT3632016.1 glycosyltransferase family 2 protein [Candidatus Neomarinimicrobiota bacterium]MBT3824602.1 glycosyltransferase family 2 protein [Candidatus Neomarinimicrobiota bacterium]MBT4130224.1 glycosyltransferase family 2 protein [Candidatus Neomarinimicrobiota bacterium]MBT4296974.1 glycosyltransferase family 2 protein [Candidatus Neomarinimicrobiota bacterium]